MGYVPCHGGWATMPVKVMATAVQPVMSAWLRFNALTGVGLRRQGCVRAVMNYGRQ